jgi:hypothetical protein
VSGDAIVFRGRYWARMVVPSPRVVSVVGEDLAIVYENETTPWSWASKPGLGPGMNTRWTRYEPRIPNAAARCCPAYWKVWLTSELRAEESKT